MELVYSGFYFDPLSRNLENFLEDIQSSVSGTVEVNLTAGRADAVGVDAKKKLVKSDAVYAQSASWTSDESTGFIKLLGQSTATWADVNKNK